MFRFNPGIENKIFPPKAPYYKTKTKKEKEVIDRILDQKQTSKAIQANNKILSKKYNLPLGKPMSYLEANEGKENPKFKKKKEDGYQTNCTLCTVTHLLRRRGFNVEASPNTSVKTHRDGRLYEFYEQNKMTWRERFLNKDKTSPTYISSNKWSKKRGIKNMKDKHLYSFLRENLSKDGLYEIAVDWKAGGSHVFCVEVLNGEKFYFDPQKGESDVFDYLKIIKPQNVDILRIDDKIVNPKIGSLFLPIK